MTFVVELNKIFYLFEKRSNGIERNNLNQPHNDRVYDSII